MAKQRQPRGPKCPVCGARMHVPEGGGNPVCSFKDNHAEIVRAQIKAKQRAADARKKSR